MSVGPAGTTSRTVPAGAADTSDAPGAPAIVAQGISVPQAVYHDGTSYHTHRGRDDTATAVPVSDTDRDDGLPDIPRYEGPAVADQPAVNNPSAGNQGPPGGGVNPMGPSPVAGSTGPVNYDQAPGNTSKGNPSY